MSRDFVGALLQLNAEKQVSREQLIRRGRGRHPVRLPPRRRRRGHPRPDRRRDGQDPRVPRQGRGRRGRGSADRVHPRRGPRRTTPTPSSATSSRPRSCTDDVFGRIGAQTAKQIVLQRIREVERDQVFDQFANREGEMITGAVNRVEPRAIILDVGNNVEAILRRPSSRPSSTTASARTSRPTSSRSGAPAAGPQIFVSRTHKGFLKRLFELEVPEIHSGTVEIKAIAREAGSRSKVAVASRQEGLDPGRRDRRPARRPRPGRRGRARRREDRHHPVERRRRASSSPTRCRPAQVISVDIDEEKRIANVTVPERMLSLAIGREGQNARLAARLTGWRIDIRSDVSVAAKAAEDEAAAGRARRDGRDRRRRPRPRPG